MGDAAEGAERRAEVEHEEEGIQQGAQQEPAAIEQPEQGTEDNDDGA